MKKIEIEDYLSKLGVAICCDIADEIDSAWYDHVCRSEMPDAQFISELAMRIQGIRNFDIKARFPLPGFESKVAQAGELLIRAAAVLGTLSKEQQADIHERTEGNLTDCLAWAIQGAAALSPSVAASLKSHGPDGFLALQTAKDVYGAKESQHG